MRTLVLDPAGRGVWTEMTESSEAVASRVTSWTFAPVSGKV
jgi:hypothetical protein